VLRGVAAGGRALTLTLLPHQHDLLLESRTWASWIFHRSIMEDTRTWAAAEGRLRAASAQIAHVNQEKIIWHARQIRPCREEPT
jgi:hypothetical protein